MVVLGFKNFMKLHKLEVYVIDFSYHGIDEIARTIESAATEDWYHATPIATAEIGPWTDEHALNLRDTGVDQYRKYFPTD